MNLDFALIGGGILIAGIIILIVMQRFRKKLSAAQIAQFRSVWKKIEQEKNANQALIMADKLVDSVLKAYGYSGTFGEKLKRHGDQLFSDLNGLWAAHKMRNKAAHDIHFHASNTECARALRAFKKALRDLNIRV